VSKNCKVDVSAVLEYAFKNTLLLVTLISWKVRD